MKKTFSVILAILMIVTAIPFAVSAGEINETVTDTITVKSGETYQVTANVDVKGKIEIMNGGVLQIMPGMTLSISTGMIANMGTILNDGTISNKGSIINTETGEIKHKVTLPASYAPEGYEVYYTTENGRTWDENFDTPDFDNSCAWSNSLPFSGYIADGESFTFTLVFKEAKIDPYKLTVSAGGVTLPRDGGIYTFTANNASTITYGQYTPSKLLKDITIFLPSGEGYRVVGYGYTLEEATQDSIDKVILDYGSDFDFRIEIFEGWQESHITVTIGGIEVEPDQYNYYHIKNLNDVDEKQGAYEINVAGVVSDDTQNLLKGIFQMLKNIFEVIKDIFESFKDLFK